MPLTIDREILPYNMDKEGVWEISPLLLRSIRNIFPKQDRYNVNRIWMRTSLEEKMKGYYLLVCKFSHPEERFTGIFA